MTNQTDLAARAQLDFVRQLVVHFASDDGVARPVAVYQSQYIAIIALLRSVGHVFDKVDCVDAGRRAWGRSRWPFWSQNKILKEFMEPARNRLLKEFHGGLELSGEAFGEVGIVADPYSSTFATHVVAFDAKQVRDVSGRPVLPQIFAAIEFWEECLAEAEEAFRHMTPLG